MEKTEAKVKVVEMIDNDMLPLDVVAEIINAYNPIIHVDRAAPVVYPDWIKKSLYPELELVGPSDFDVTKLDLYLHLKQAEGHATGIEIHEDLIAKKMIAGCLGLNDLKAIQARGIGFFRKHYAGKVIPGWRSVVRSRGGDLGVPCLIEGGDEVIVRWGWLGSDFHSGDPALRFRK